MGKSSEKRKRLEDVKIKPISENEKKSSPIIGYFPSGFDSLKNSVGSVNVYKNLNSRNRKNPRMEVVVGVGKSAVSFVGTNYSGEARAPQLCNYALGVLDKETGVLKMVPIAANKIFRLDPKIAGLEEPETETTLADGKTETTEERNAKFRSTAIKYCSKRNIRKDEKREILRQIEDAGSQQGMEMELKLKGIKARTEEIEAIALTPNAHNIPPHNMETTDPNMAYPLDKIILKGEWDYLKDILEKVHAGSEFSPDVYPRFVLNRVHALQNTKDELNRRRKAGILSYITHLIRFKDQHSMDGVSSAKHHKLPSILSQKFSAMFGSTKDKQMPQDKLISYVLVLALIVDDFRSNPSDITKDLRVGMLDVRNHYNYLGCKFVLENLVPVVTLPLPLQFETVKITRHKS